MEYDVAIIGSGFGGSVSALRLSEKGYRVVVIEQGQWVTPEDMEEGNNKVTRLNWIPAFGQTGYFSQHFFKHVSIVGGVGVGGGSLVYAAVLLKPKDDFYADASWSALGINWKEELAPHYETATRMLGVADNPHFDIQDDYLKKTAEAMNAEATFGPTPNGIYYGIPEVMKPDPFFSGEGPSRSGCFLCGRCLTGCPHGSKNTLDKNYLYLAQRMGATILTARKVEQLKALKDGDYELKMQHPVNRGYKYQPIKAKKVIIAAGVLGTLELLFKCRDVSKTLPEISQQLGKVVRTNSEAIVGILSPERDLDLTRGTAISSHFYPDDHTHITQNRFPKGYNFMKWFLGPMVDHSSPLIRSWKTLWTSITRPSALSRNWFARNWYKRVTVLTVMQHLDNRIAFKYKRRFPLFWGKKLRSVGVKGKSAPTYLPVANQTARKLAEISSGKPLNILTESLGNISTTAHILGGCHMGSSSENGVINTSHEVFGYAGLYVINGASVSANIGANPSLTITAMAERAMSLIPEKKE